jgi:putative lipase involved disintegration of autophagic bodies
LLEAVFDDYGYDCDSFRGQVFWMMMFVKSVVLVTRPGRKLQSFRGIQIRGGRNQVLEPRLRLWKS